MTRKISSDFSILEKAKIILATHKGPSRSYQLRAIMGTFLNVQAFEL